MFHESDARQLIGADLHACDDKVDEKVGLAEEVEETEETVSEQVRKERVEVEGDVDRNR